jgi:hypothetical protein
MASSTSETAVEPRFEARCKVCTAGDKGLVNGSAVRTLADELLVVPMTYPGVLRLLEPLMVDWPDEKRFSTDSLRRHAQRHLRWEEAALRAVADRRAGHLARVSDASEKVLHATVVFETIRQRGLDLLMQDEVRPTVKDLVAATTALQDLEQEADESLSPAVLLSQLNTVIQIIREEVPESRWEHVVTMLDERTSLDTPPPERDPVFDELTAEMESMDG